MKKVRPKTVGSGASLVKSVRIPSHDLSTRLRAVLRLIETTHDLPKLDRIDVEWDSEVKGGQFVAHAPRGPYEIRLNPDGNHPELTLLHEVGHFLEWYAIPKQETSNRDFDKDPRFDDWLDAVLASANIRRMISHRDRQAANLSVYEDLNYLLRPEELWTRAYSQYVARTGGQAKAAVLFQQIAAENKIVKGGIMYKPYWSWSDFSPVQNAIEQILRELGWTK